MPSLMDEMRLQANIEDDNTLITRQEKHSLKVMTANIIIFSYLKNF